MRLIALLSLAGMLFVAAHIDAAEPVAAKSRIVSIDLFKNGLAVVRRTGYVGGQLDDAVIGQSAIPSVGAHPGGLSVLASAPE